MNMCPSNYRSSAVPVFKQSSFIAYGYFILLEKTVVYIMKRIIHECLEIPDLLLRLPVGRGGVINSPRSVFLCFYYSACRRRGGVLKCPRFFFFYFFFRCRKSAESWAAAHGLYRCAVYRLLSEPMSTRLLNSISSRICRQNTQFNMYTTTSKQQGC